LKVQSDRGFERRPAANWLSFKHAISPFVSVAAAKTARTRPCRSLRSQTTRQAAGRARAVTAAHRQMPARTTSRFRMPSTADRTATLVVRRHVENKGLTPGLSEYLEPSDDKCREQRGKLVARCTASSRQAQAPSAVASLTESLFEGPVASLNELRRRIERRDRFGNSRLVKNDAIMHRKALLQDGAKFGQPCAIPLAVRPRLRFRPVRITAWPLWRPSRVREQVAPSHVRVLDILPTLARAVCARLRLAARQEPYLEQAPSRIHKDTSPWPRRASK
jgi:hypothetical protein